MKVVPISVCEIQRCTCFESHTNSSCADPMRACPCQFCMLTPPERYPFSSRGPANAGRDKAAARRRHPTDERICSDYTVVGCQWSVVGSEQMRDNRQPITDNRVTDNTRESSSRGLR